MVAPKGLGSAYGTRTRFICLKGRELNPMSQAPCFPVTYRGCLLLVLGQSSSSPNGRITAVLIAPKGHGTVTGTRTPDLLLGKETH